VAPAPFGTGKGLLTNGKLAIAKQGNSGHNNQGPTRPLQWCACCDTNGAHFGSENMFPWIARIAKGAITSGTNQHAPVRHRAVCPARSDKPTMVYCKGTKDVGGRRAG